MSHPYILDAVISLGAFLVFVYYYAHAEILTSLSKEEAKGKQIQEPQTYVDAQGPTIPTDVEGNHKKMIEQVSEQLEVDMVAQVGIENQGRIFFLC